MQQHKKLINTSRLHDAFHGPNAGKDPEHRHESARPSCGYALPNTSETWIQYPGEPNINSELPADIKQKLGIKEKFGDCFHPNDAGARAYANAVNEAALMLGR
jgi:hypothetical protein